MTRSADPTKRSRCRGIPIQMGARVRFSAGVWWMGADASGRSIWDNFEGEGVMIPGEMFVADGSVELNAGREAVVLMVANTGDRPVQVGSHYHFFEANPALEFDRDAARGMRLDIAAGTAVRFEPGQRREVALVAIGGDRRVYGFNGKVMGAL